MNSSNSKSNDREIEATKRITIIIVFYMISTLPLKIVNFLNSACDITVSNEVLIKSLIILTHVKPAVNPMLYAYHLRDFRQTLMKLFRPRNTNQTYKLKEIQLRTDVGCGPGRDVSGDVPKSQLTSISHLSNQSSIV